LYPKTVLKPSGALDLVAKARDCSSLEQKSKRNLEAGVAVMATIPFFN
jgi:hypothetical protein